MPCAKILVVDDSAEVREFCQMILGDKYELSFATNGAEADERLAASKPDLILLDIYLPRVDGLMLAEKYKADPELSHIPIVMMSGLMADTFAGERERDTLEALLASRLPDRAILLGKTAAVAAYGWAVTSLCGLTGAAAVWFSSGGQAAVFSAQTVLALPLLSFLAAWYVACLGVLISLRAQSVHQAQQWMSVAMLGTLIAVGLYAAPLLLARWHGNSGKGPGLQGGIILIAFFGWFAVAWLTNGGVRDQSRV